MNTSTPEGIWEGIEPCPIHVAEWDPTAECEGCKAEADARATRIEQLQAEASHRVKGLAQAGIGFPAQALDSIKVDILWQMVFQGRAAYEAEGELGRRAIEMIKSMQAEASRAQLLQPKQSQGLTVVRNGRGPKGH